MWGRTHIPVANIAGVCSWRKQHLSPLVKLLTTCAALCCCADVSCIDISDSNTGISTVELCIPAQTASTNSNFVHRSVEYICASASWAVHCHCSKVHHTLLVTWHTGFDEYESFLSAFITLFFMFFMMDHWTWSFLWQCILTLAVALLDIKLSTARWLHKKKNVSVYIKRLP